MEHVVEEFAATWALFILMGISASSIVVVFVLWYLDARRWKGLPKAKGPHRRNRRRTSNHWIDKA